MEPTVEFLQGKTEGPGEKPVPVPLCPPQIPLVDPGIRVERSEGGEPGDLRSYLLPLLISLSSLLISHLLL
jgi:hypothetical protein